jgi:predicted membrane protein
MASGDLDLVLDGRYQQPVAALISTASGDLELDLRGSWAASSTVRVRIASGDVELKVPNDVAVVVRAKTLSGDVRASGLQRSGSGFVNNLAGVAAVGLDIEVETISGDVRIDAR